LNTAKSLDPQKLLKEANAAEHKEACMIVERNEIFRVGVGAKASALKDSTFFVEVNLKLSPESGEVDMLRLAKTIQCLRTLQTRGYTLTCQDDTFISCEKIRDAKNVTKEYTAVTSLLKTKFDKLLDE